MADDEFDRNARARRTRSIVIGLVLAGFVLLFFVMTIVRLGLRFG
ncbi:MAG TPA: hypothetical protein VGM17_13755 [Rhizomicrobium sp.]|jgi:hypothetical protein